MARLVLKLDGNVLGEYALSNTAVTIGRLPDNDIHIDDLSVSGHHAKIVLEDGQYAVHDESSTNGTYVNGQKLAYAVLTNEDSVLIGRHLLVFEEEKAAPVAARPLAAAPPAMGAVPNPVPVKITSPLDKKQTVTITVMAGKTDQQEYVLGAQSAVIGKSEGANIRLTRWFAPKVATTIYYRDGKYYIGESQTPTPVRVNSEVVQGEKLLEPGDTILVDDVTLIFNARK
ncbi:FHA domain containing protein [Candidatus Koribacter versatilis Ellin345]|uniref:FHA domain containing protein n=1 Tax=Koribacter versatilis (strain Ellin345) TaxID=204669 RepID=Q1IIH1_KORVE|nr:FHA domain-containing protein [Candidatus Koribacter versatilis]ABF43329.1 FHA domain containing protein [Candidatus Koribacter versatilis Ellin345]